MKYLAFVLLAAMAAACRSDRAYPPGPTFLIEDGNHNGNAFFYWLSPIVKQQAPDWQTFSKQLGPTITITDLCTGSVIRSISGADVQVGNGKYQANWRTSEDDLDAACTYRLTISVGARQLGLADLDVVDKGRELKNVNTDEFVPLLDDRTLPIKFFIGVGSMCDPGVSDCGEGVARPGMTTTIVTSSGRAGLLVPAGAVSENVTIAIQSVDNSPANVCIPGLINQYAGTEHDNACYDYRATPTAGNEQLGHYKFDSNVTVGICPPVNAMQESHAVLDLLQIYRFDDVGGGNTLTQALRNVPAPFLRCDPNHDDNNDDTVLGTVGRALLNLIGPRPLYASATSAAFDLGSGGSSDGFSRFTWALPVGGMLNFELNPDQLPIAAGAVINNAYSRIGVTLSRTGGTLGGVCPGTAVYANSLDGSNNAVSHCPQETAPAFSALSGAIVARFTVPVVRVCIDATPIVGPPPLIGPLPDAAFIEGLASDGSVLSRITAKATQQAQSLCINQSGVAAVRFAGLGSTLTRFDNLTFSRIPSP